MQCNDRPLQAVPPLVEVHRRAMARSRTDLAHQLAVAIRALKDAALERHRAAPGSPAYAAALAREIRIDQQVLELARRQEPRPSLPRSRPKA